MHLTDFLIDVHTTTDEKWQLSFARQGNQVPPTRADLDPLDKFHINELVERPLIMRRTQEFHTKIFTHTIGTDHICTVEPRQLTIRSSQTPLIPLGLKRIGTSCMS